MVNLIKELVRHRHEMEWQNRMDIFSSKMSVNRGTEVEIKDEDMELLRECERRGFIKIRIKK